jgi:hypothetical protein
LSASFEPDLDGELRTFVQGDVFEQKANHSLPLPIGRVRIAPKLRKVGGQAENLRPLSLAQHRLIGLALPVILLLCLGESP